MTDQSNQQSISTIVQEDPVNGSLVVGGPGEIRHQAKGSLDQNYHTFLNGGAENNTNYAHQSNSIDMFS